MGLLREAHAGRWVVLDAKLPPGAGLEEILLVTKMGRLKIV
jgi:hypothetical protein